MSYPVDPSEVYELRGEVERLRAENATLGRRHTDALRRRFRAERAAKEYADANARALRVIAVLTDGPVLHELAAPPPPPSVFVKGSE